MDTTTQTRPEALTVYWSQAAQGLTRYDFDAAGWKYAATIAGPTEGTIEINGTTYLIAGPSNDQIVTTYARGRDFQPYYRAWLAVGGERSKPWDYMAWIGGQWRAWEATQGRKPDSPKDDADRDAFLAWLNAEVVAAIVPGSPAELVAVKRAA